MCEKYFKKLLLTELISLLINFIKKQTNFIGTASELASTLGGETKANVLIQRLSRYKNELADMGITANIYSHIDSESKKASAMAIGSALS